MGGAAFKIDTNIPVPSHRGREGTLTDALRSLAKASPGSSILLPTTFPVISSTCRTALGCGMRAAGLTGRAVDGGIRVWKL